MTDSRLPDIYSYLDYRTFLSAWFDAKKRMNPRYSHRMFVRAAGFASPAVLHNVIHGKRNLTGQSAVSFANAMKLTEDERQFFLALVDLDQATNDEERNDAWRAVSAHRRFRRARKLDSSSFEFLSNWYWPVIHQFASHPEFQSDPAWIADQMRPRIDEAQAEEAMEGLRTLGLFVKDEDGQERPVSESVITPPEVANLAACNYHRQMSLRAHDAVADVPAALRHLLAITIGVPSDLVPTMKDELNRFHARLLDLCASAEADTDTVYQINLQLFPLTAWSEDP